jgi:hypothetical protein
MPSRGLTGATESVLRSLSYTRLVTFTVNGSTRRIGSETGKPRARNGARLTRRVHSLVSSLGLKNAEAWRGWDKSGEKPDDIPSAPWDIYA